MIEIKNDNRDDLRKQIQFNLRNFNRSRCEWLNTNTLASVSKKNYNNFMAYDENILIGGIVGFIQYDWYFIELLWIDEKFRGNKVGTILLKNVEDYAKTNNLFGIRTETWDFQAKGFYEKMGYSVFAQIADCPPGTIEYFLKKLL